MSGLNLYLMRVCNFHGLQKTFEVINGQCVIINNMCYKWTQLLPNSVRLQVEGDHS